MDTTIKKIDDYTRILVNSREGFGESELFSDDDEKVSYWTSWVMQMRTGARSLQKLLDCNEAGAGLIYHELTTFGMACDIVLHTRGEPREERSAPAEEYIINEIEKKRPIWPDREIEEASR